MSLFDRLAASPPAAAPAADRPAGGSEEEALQMIAAGNAIEDEGKLAEALRHYDDAVKLAPTLARAHLNRGNVLLAMGDANGAIAAYATALEKDPNYAGAHFNLGNAYVRSGRTEEALPAYRKAIAVNPDFVDAEIALGSALDDLGRLEEATASYRRALAIRPDHAEVHNNLGWTLKRLGRVDDAIASYRHAISLDPDHPAAHRNLGDILHEQGQLDAAASCYRRALELRPDDVDTRNNLGNVQKDLGQAEAAIATYREVLKVMPDSAEVHNNIGVALMELKDFPAAIASFRRALDINPKIADLHYNLGNALKSIDRAHAAVESFREAIRLDPDNSGAHCNLGNALCVIGQLNEALACYRRTLELKPDYFVAHNNMGKVLNDLGEADRALECYREALRINPDYRIAHSNLLFGLNYRVDQGAAMMLAEARRYGEFAARDARPYTAWRNTPDPERRLRVGLVSGDLRNHAVGHFLEAVLAAFAATVGDQIEILAYPTHFVADTVTARIRAACRGWQSAVRLSDEEFAKRIHDDRIDILLDVSGHTEHNRLSMFAWKPAPVQATWLGYLATTGVAAMDYLIADPWALPPAEENSFTEKIWRLPESYLCFTAPRAKADVSPLPAGPDGPITFGSFNNLTKVNDAVVAVWARLLDAVPDSRLYIKGKQFGEAPTREQMRARFAAHGTDPGRLILAAHVPTGEHLLPFQRVDISLDPFPYPGITTTVESLWMGVPVLTMAGKTFLSRQGVSILTNAGLPEWIAVDAEDYVARGAAHARDRQALATLRSGLRQQVLASPIFDAPRFARHFAIALRGMWQAWCRQQRERSF